MSKLLDSDSDDDSQEFKINENYAENYNKFREKEVYQKLKDKYGEDAAKKNLDNALEEDSSDESEDDEAEALTEEVEKDFFKTLAMLKTKDPRIYDGKTTFFKKEPKDLKGKSKSSKPLTIGDLQRKVILEKEGQFEDLPDQQLLQKARDKTYVQEMDELKQAFKNDEAESDDELFVKKTKSEAEIKQEDNDYRQWLKGQTSEAKNEQTEKELGGLKAFWSQKNLSKDEKFLRDYLLNKKYLDDDQDPAADADDDLDDDQAQIANQEDFETKYNFRFEEPDAEFIKRYPRTITDTLRKKDSSRKRKREELKARKEQEKAKQREELKQLKALKRKEIVEKIKKLEKVTGSELAFKEEDIDEDFDPEEYDKRMAEVFENYDREVDEEKPSFSDLSDSEVEEENWDEWDGNSDPGEGTSKGSKFHEALSKSKPTFDPEDKTFQQYLDEYYQLDYEDQIGDLKCRFKYRKVEPTGFGLSTEEILTAPDRELNAWCSLKKTCQFITPEEERKAAQEFDRKGTNLKLKQRVLPSLFKEDQEPDLEAEAESKSKKSRKRKRKNQNAPQSEVVEEKPDKKRKRGSGDQINAEIKMSDDRLKAYGLVPNQYKRKVKKAKYVKK